MRHIARLDDLSEPPCAEDVSGRDPVSRLPSIPLTPIPVTGRTGPRPGY
jgi:hypothetical protein